MRRIAVENLRVNSVAAVNIYDSNLKLLIAKNKKLDEKIIKHLKELQILSVYIIDEYSPQVIEDVVNEFIRLDAIKRLKEIAEEFKSIELDKRYDIVENDYINNIIYIAEQIVDELLSKDALVIQQIDVRNIQNFNYSHSVNVAIMSVIIGIELKYDRNMLINLSTAALLHDIGKCFLHKKISFDLFDKNQNKQERMHTYIGYEYLSKYQGIHNKIKLAVLNHHERIDGSGYPNGIKGDNIDEFSKIIAIVNFYDNLMSKGYMLQGNLPNDILEKLISYSSSAFDYEIMKIFYKKVISFSKGTIVKLSNNDIALVEGTIEGIPLRPIVRIIKSQDNKKNNKCINLVDELGLTIVEIIDYIDNIDDN